MDKQGIPVGCRRTRHGDVQVVDVVESRKRGPRVLDVHVTAPAVWSTPSFRVVNPPELVASTAGDVLVGATRPAEPTVGADAPEGAGPHLSPHEGPAGPYVRDSGLALAETLGAAGGTAIARTRR